MSNESPKTLLLLSGGMDSVGLLYWLSQNLAHQVEAVFFNYGSNHMSQERRFARQHCQSLSIPLHRLELPKMAGSQLVGDSQSSWVVPGRNSILLSHAVNFAESHRFQFVAYGSNADDADTFPDCRESFVSAYNQLLMTSRLSVRLIAPFVTMTKQEIASLADLYNYPIKESWSCYSDHADPCGSCPACKKRNAALLCD